MSPHRWALALLALATAARLLVAARWGVLADEAYYWAWSRELALGYFDHPPLIAWVLAPMPPMALALRAPGILLQAVGAWACLGMVPKPVRFVGLVSVLPALSGVGLFATPDALLLGLWPLALAAAWRGGRGWWLAGALTGLAVLAKYTGVLLLPLLFLAAAPGERRTRHPWLGLGGTACVVAPHAVWSWMNGFPALAFQAQHGLGQTIGWRGPLQVLGQQLMVGTPLVAVAAAAWGASRPTDRATRVAWWTSGPVVLLFVLAAARGVPEANWPAPAWWGLALGLASTVGWKARMSEVGAWLGLFGAVAVVVHVERPVLPLPSNPVARLESGQALAGDAVRWAMPPGTPAWGPRRGEATLILTERYQEASTIRFHTGIRAVPWQGCGRPNQLEGRPTAPTAVFVRPHRGGPPTCVADGWVVGRVQRMPSHDAYGRPIGDWDWFELTARPSEGPSGP